MLIFIVVQELDAVVYQQTASGNSPIVVDILVQAQKYNIVEILMN